MKKLLLGLGTLAAVVAPITTVVACGKTSNTGDAIETPTTPDNGNQNPGTSSSETQTVTPDTTQVTTDPSVTQIGTPTATQVAIESVFATEFKKEYPGQTYDPSSTVAAYLNTAQRENPEFYKDIPAIKAVLFWSDDAKVKNIIQSGKKTNDYTLHQKLYDKLRKMVLGETSDKEIVASEFEALFGSFPLYLPKVTLIDNNAFTFSSLTSLSLPLVTSIDDSAFMLSELTSLNLPKVTSIGDNAFTASHFTSLNLPLVSSIGNGAFAAAQLTSLNLPLVSSIGDGAFSSFLLTSLNLPKVTSIGDGAFQQARLTELSLPLVTSIGNSAFILSKLTSLNLPLFTSIGESCWNPSSIPIPTNVDSSHPGFFAFPGNNNATKEEYDEYIKNNHIESNDSPEVSV